VVSSSSTKRAARLAQKGKGKRVRFQGGTLFPMIVLLILVIGVGTIVYARASVPAADASPPTIQDHWHMAYGFSLCDQPDMVKLQGNLEDPNGATFNEYERTGVHSHDDGVIHWHPFTSASVGKRAQLGVFLKNYGVEMSDTELKFPKDQNGGKTYKEGETKCPGDKDGELSVTVWSSPDDKSSGQRYVTDFNDIKMDKNSLVLTIAFQPKGTTITMPPWAPNLAQLGAVDTGQQPPTASTTTAPGATPVTPTTVSGAPPTVAPAGAPTATTVAPTTTG